MRVLRLFGLLFLFSILTLYAVFRSDRFQEILRKRAERSLRELTGREVRIGGFDLALVPPAFVVRNVSIANDTRGLRRPAFSAEEIVLRGLPAITSNRVSLPKVRVVSPHAVFEIFPDGSNNFSTLIRSLPKSRGAGGPDLRLKELILQNGMFRFREWSTRLDLEVRNAAATASSPFLSPTTTGSIVCHSIRLKIGKGEIAEFGLGIDAILEPGRISLSRVAMRGRDLFLEGAGGIPDLKKPELGLTFALSVTAEVLDRYFNVGLPFTGDINATGYFRAPFGKPLELVASFDLPAAQLGPFPMEGKGSFRLDPGGVLVHLPAAKYAGGELEVLVRVSRLKNPPLPIRVLGKGRGLDFEKFFADLDLPGTGLMARADLDVALSFEKGGIEAADGAATLILRQDPGRRSAVPGRHAIPLSGGGPILIKNGHMVFSRTNLVTQGGLKLALSGRLPFESWKPDFDIEIDAPDLSEAERLAENLYPAIQKEPLTPPLKLAGQGQFSGRLERDFSNPLVTGRFIGSGFFLHETPFGKLVTDIRVDGNQLTLEKFDATDGEGRLSVTGDIGWGGALSGHYRIAGLDVETARWPLERILKFLDFDLPMTGLISGKMPLNGVTPSVSGTAPMILENGVLWGQPVDRLSAKLGFLDDRIALSGAEGVFGTGRVRGNLDWRYSDEFRFDVDAAGLPLSKIGETGTGPSTLLATLDGKASGRGTLDDPHLEAELLVSQATYGGKDLIPPNETARLSLNLEKEGLRASLSTSSSVSIDVSPERSPKRHRVKARIGSLGFFAPILGLDDPAFGFDGSLEGDCLVSEEASGEFSVTGSLTRGTVAFAGRKATLSSASPFTFSEGVLRFGKLLLRDDSPATPAEAEVWGNVETREAGSLEVNLSGKMDASYLRSLEQDADITGPLKASLRVAGPRSAPTVSGRVALDGVDYLAHGSRTAVKGIHGTLLFEPGRLSTNDLRFWFDGNVSMAGTVTLNGLSPDSIHINTTIDRMKVSPFDGFRALASGDLLLLGSQGQLETARGELTLTNAVYDQNFDLDVGLLLNRFLSSGPRPPAISRFDPIGLDVRVAIPAPGIDIRNNLARIRATGQLTARGSVGRPVLFGQVEALDGGRLSFRGLRYDVLAGKLVFVDPYKIDPYFEFEARTLVKTYQITLALSGTMSKLNTRLSADPPLSEAQIVSTITTGEAPSSSFSAPPSSSNPVSTDEAIAKAARELLTGLATSAAAERTRELLKLDRLQIDPVFVGSSIESTRFTVAKTIGKDLTVTYSYKPGVNLEQLISVEYTISPNSFVQGIRDENGIFALDFRLRQRLR